MLIMPVVGLIVNVEPPTVILMPVLPPVCWNPNVTLPPFGSIASTSNTGPAAPLNGILLPASGVKFVIVRIGGWFVA